ncbi:unnamed protein product [Adineta steineri]|uniref:RNA ligase domain-containing protein n=1 Tax=Adineta steineri TaxID=433720 RepID=A0A815LAI5_9BILA|nr:unnamed protein product [Adineta steineri]CAF3855869.1 unnamed protein product [Adineta steineri]
MISYPATEQFLQAITKADRYATVSSNSDVKDQPIMNFIGTVKLHGTNAAIGYQKDSHPWCQSRNRVITPNNDNAGFAKHIYPYANNFFFSDILPHCPTIRHHYENGDKIVIFGEWCGGTIQKNVAIYDLPTMFIIFKIQIVNQYTGTDADNQEQHATSYWLHPQEWSNIKCHVRSIYNIFDFPTYTIQVDFNRPELSQETLTKITEQVERQCPVGAHFNRFGIGEGVVWAEWTQTAGNLTFKVKGRQHQVTQGKALVSVNVAKFTRVDHFIQYSCTENRMRQALDYMREQNVSIEMKNLRIFLRWLVTDICKEEKAAMNASNINTKEIHEAISKRTKAWFMKVSIENQKKMQKEE